jgi:hypothetical protein
MTKAEITAITIVVASAVIAMLFTVTDAMIQLHHG